VVEFLIFRFAIIIGIASELADIGVATGTIHKLQNLEFLGLLS